MLGKNLRRIRTEQRYTRKQLADLCGCTATTIRNIEVGENDNPRIKTLISLSKVLKVSIKTLIK